MAAKVESGVLNLKPIEIKYATIHIVGDGDIVLNKKSEAAERELTADDRKAQKLWEQQHKNKYEDVITLSPHNLIRYPIPPT